MAAPFHVSPSSPLLPLAPQANEDEYTGSGDVKYHLGTSYNRPTTSGKMVALSLMANPSHLEAVNTVVLGECGHAPPHCGGGGWVPPVPPKGKGARATRG